MAKKQFSGWLDYRLNEDHSIPKKRKDVYGVDLEPVSHDVVRHDRIVREVEYVAVDRSEENKKYKVSDFYLENLIALGCDLKPMRLDGSLIEDTDSIMSTLEFLDDYEKNNKENNIMTEDE